MDDRAAKETGILPWIGSTIARWRAEDPEPPQEIRPPRGLDELNGLLAQVRAATGPALPAIQRDATGTSMLKARAWCELAGLHPAVGVLAVLLASEAEPIADVPQYAWAIGEAVVNAARAIRHDGELLEDAIVRRVVGDARPAMDGRFTKQGGRWASTAQAPTRRHVRCADLVYARAMGNFPEILAHGARQWTDNFTQHRVHVKAVEAGDLEKARRNPPPEVVMANRYASGAKWVGPICDALGTAIIDPWKLTLLGRRGVDLDVAMAMLADGRRRYKQPA